MKSICLHLFFLLGINFSSAQCLTNINFNSWTQAGPLANGTWTVTPSGDTVVQSINGQPTYFISPENFINAKIKGTIQVNSAADDDYVGFVFGLKSPTTLTSSITTFEGFVFDWKQGTQTFPSTSFVGEEGFNLMKIDGLFDFSNGASFNQEFWAHQNTSKATILGTDYGPTKGWNDFQSYDFELTYTSTQIIIKINSLTIFEVSGCFEPGRFGFYNYSQNSVIYSDFAYNLITDFDIGTPILCLNDTGRFEFFSVAKCGITGIDSSTIDYLVWEFSDGFKDTGLFVSRVFSAPDTIEIKLKVYDTFGCVDSIIKSVIIVPVPNPTADFGFSNACFGAPVFFQDSSKSNGGIGIMNVWLWDFDDGNNSLTPSPVKNYQASGSYNVTLIVGNDSLCYDTISKTVQVYSLPLFDLGKDTSVCWDEACFNFELDSLVSYLWLSASANYDTSANSLFFCLDSSDLFFVEATDSNNCVYSDSITISVYDKPLAFANDDTTIFNGEVIDIGAMGGLNYLWTQNISLSCNNCQYPTVSPNDTTVYYVLITDSNDCTVFDTIVVNVLYNPFLEKPLAFTPNGDGLNDELILLYQDIKELLDFSVHNRWGQQVFFTMDINTGWDGKFKGKEQPSGTYIFHLKAITLEEESIDRVGTIVLIR